MDHLQESYPHQEVRRCSVQPVFRSWLWSDWHDCAALAHQMANLWQPADLSRQHTHRSRCRAPLLNARGPPIPLTLHIPPTFEICATG